MGFLSFLAPVLGLAGSLLGASSAAKATTQSGQLSLQGAREQNETNILLARENREFQERLANTAVQRRRDDLAKAGINPILAGAQNGAQSPSSAAATVANVQTGPANAKLQKANILANLAQSVAQTRLTVAQTLKTKFEASSAKSQSFKDEVLKKPYQVIKDIAENNDPNTNVFTGKKIPSKKEIAKANQEKYGRNYKAKPYFTKKKTLKRKQPKFYIDKHGIRYYRKDTL